MKRLFTRYPDYNAVEQAAWFLVWFTLPLSLKLNGLSIILAACIILVQFAWRPFLPDRRKLIYLLFPVLFFLWHAKELFGSHPFLPVWKETEKMLSFLVIPLLFALSRIGKGAFTRAAVAGLVPALVIGGIFMLAAAGIRFIHSENWNEFIYHNLAKPIHPGAIYFSLYLLFAMFKLDDEAWLKHHHGLKTGIGLYLLFVLLLCASKLLIGLGLPLLAWHYRRLFFQGRTKYRKLIVALFFLVALGSIPFVKRVATLVHPKLEMVGLENFKGSPEPNGLNLRLILWRFGIEILNEQHAWFKGVGMSRTQELLNLKFYQYGMYTGTNKGTDTGYLNYNFHNQYIETTVTSGIPGLVFLIVILVVFAIQPRNRLFAPTMFILIISGFFLTESVLERQAGIVFFCLIYSAYFIVDKNVANTNKR